ncbi:hypothetical protein MMC22_000187 [Lobaria immixta]|nr:hypothetical protein [Lobaria immixta]
MSGKVDDKSNHCISFILERLQIHQQKWKNESSRTPPLFVGVNGSQGAGKTTLVSSLALTLSRPPHRIPTIVLSIDDFYLSHELQAQLAASNPDNPLIQHRGQPSTHDLTLALSLFASLRDGREIEIPSYDKSAFGGEGERTPQSEWKVVNGVGEERIRVIILEGWCVGFRALEDQELQNKWEKAEIQRKGGNYQGRLGWNRFEDVKFVNEALRGYDSLTNQLDALIHINAEDPRYVYEWRLEQEAALRQVKGTGMTDEQVIDFVNGCKITTKTLQKFFARLNQLDYPAYELYTDRLRLGVFGKEKGKQLQLSIGKSRKVNDVMRL